MTEEWNGILKFTLEILKAQFFLPFFYVGYVDQYRSSKSELCNFLAVWSGPTYLSPWALIYSLVKLE